MIGMWLGANAPERLDHLVLCNTGATIGTGEAWNARIEAVQKKRHEVDQFGSYRAMVHAVLPQKAPEAISSTLKMIEEANPEGYAACCAAVRDFDFREQLRTIHVLALVIAGAHDPATPPADGAFSPIRFRVRAMLNSTPRTFPISKIKTGSTEK